MNADAEAIARIAQLARGLAHDDFALDQMCRRLYDIVRRTTGAQLFHIALEAEDGSLQAEYFVRAGSETEPQPLAEDAGARQFPLLHGEQRLGVVSVGADAAALQASRAQLEAAFDIFALALASVHRIRATERRIDRDPLTSLYNRSYGVRRLEEELQRAVRMQTRVCALVVDVDGVADLNARFGHQTGDAAIRTVSDALRSICRHSDVLCRLGGDRFLVVYPGFGDGNAAAVASRVRTQIEMRVLPVPGGAIGLKASIGVAVGAHERAGALVQQCERALEEEKTRRGRRTR